LAGGKAVSQHDDGFIFGFSQCLNSSFLSDCPPLFKSSVQAIIILHLLLSLEDPFRPEVEEVEVEMGSGGPKGFNSHCEDLGSGAVKLPLSHNSPKKEGWYLSVVV